MSLFDQEFRRARRQAAKGALRVVKLEVPRYGSSVIDRKFRVERCTAPFFWTEVEELPLFGAESLALKAAAELRQSERKALKPKLIGVVQVFE